MRLDVDTAGRGMRGTGLPERGGRVAGADAQAIARMCADLVAVLLVERGDIGAELERLRRAAVGWACCDVPIETANGAVRDAVDGALARLEARFANNPDGLVPGVRRLLRIRERALLAILAGFTAVAMLDDDSVGAPLDVLAEHIAAGRAEALPGGAVVAESYAVVAVAFGVAGRRRAGRAGVSRARLLPAQWLGPSTFSALGKGGGTILIPLATADRRTVGELVAAVARAVRTPVTAVVVDGDRAELRAVAEHAHTLLDIAQRLDYRAGLYAADDLALEYQLTRPGPARDIVAAILDPLEQFPQLLETLRVHMSAGMNQKGTAGSLGVHRNTVGYRLRRIEDLTGYDPTTESGLCYLRSAYLVRSFRRRPGWSDRNIH